jgi:hypothetical protein
VSKRSRAFQPPAARDERVESVEPAAAAGGPDRATASQRPTRRAEARRRSGSSVLVGPQSPLERFRGLLIVAAVVLGVGIVGIFLYQSTSAAPYECDTLLTPGPSEPVRTAAPSPVPPSPSPAAEAAPTVSPVAADATAEPDVTASPEPTPEPSPEPTPVPEPTQRVGFTTADLGQAHAATNSTTRYAFCPPTSGTHWSAAGVAPARRDFYGPENRVWPGAWVHNLEHGYVVMAYAGEPDAAVLAQMREVFDQAPPSEVARQCGLPNKVMTVRFDDMAEPFAMLAWSRALLMETFDPDLAMTFAEQWQDGPQTPERAC